MNDQLSISFDLTKKRNGQNTKNQKSKSGHRKNKYGFSLTNT